MSEEAALTRRVLELYLQDVKRLREQKLSACAARLEKRYGLRRLPSEDVLYSRDPQDPRVRSQGHGAEEKHEKTCWVWELIPGKLPSRALLQELKELNHPCIFRRGALADERDAFRCIDRWQSASYLRSKLGDDTLVTVAQTPDGLADALRPADCSEREERNADDLRFVQPYEKKVRFAEMMHWLEDPKHDGRVWYAQLQNGSFNLEFAKLADDLKASGPTWAAPLAPDYVAADDAAEDASTGTPPLCNFWLGNGLSVTSTHHDPFENIFMQNTGGKRFLLYPPEDIAFLGQDEFASARYAPASGSDAAELTAIDENAPSRLHTEGESARADEDSEAKVTWLRAPWPPHPAATPVQVTLGEGELLYLPALWWHTVRQIDSAPIAEAEGDGPPRCLSVNWWWDVDYASNTWAHYKLLERLAMLADCRNDACDEDMKLDE